MQKMRSSESLSEISKADPPPLDSATPLLSRFGPPPEAIVQRLHRQNASLHTLSDAERANLITALEQLPPYAKKALKDHARTISFFDGLFGNATTMMERESKEPTFNIVIRASLLNENISEFLTRKEQTCYTISNTDSAVTVEAGTLSALVYIFLHETTHIIDLSNRHGTEGPPQLFKANDAHQLVAGIWADEMTIVPVYDSPLLDQSWFRTRKPVSIDEAEATYRALARTPFASLYGSSNWYDDVADLVACFYLTQQMRQPYQIVVSKGTKAVFTLRPMDSKLVQSRLSFVTPLIDASQNTLPANHS